MLFKKITKPIGNLLINWLIIRPYTLLFKLKAPLNHWRAHFTPYQLGRPETIIYIALFLSLLVSTNSFKIKALASEDFGLNNLISPLIIPEEEFFSGDNETDGQLTLPNDSSYTLTPDGAAILKPTLVSTLPGTLGRKSLEYYTIRSGDTISSVATRFNLKMTTLLWENRLTERSTLRIGQTLTILPSDGVSYRIGRGDTL
ncbi:MAG: LysM peptidoglycan-binding domain-containing protein, partial [Patescibacteria group bacterium]